MAKRNRPRRGSMAFSPRKRSARTFGHVNSWPTTDASEVRVQGFAGWKAGMTHILSRDLNPTSLSAGQEYKEECKQGYSGNNIRNSRAIYSL